MSTRKTREAIEVDDHEIALSNTGKILFRKPA